MTICVCIVIIRALRTMIVWFAAQHTVNAIGAALESVKSPMQVCSDMRAQKK